MVVRYTTSVNLQPQTPYCYTKINLKAGISYEADFIIKSIGTKYGVYAEQKIHSNHESNKVTHKNLNPSSKKNTTSKESSYSDKKKQLLDEYLGKKITKEEYFKLRRELDKSHRN